MTSFKFISAIFKTVSILVILFNCNPELNRNPSGLLSILYTLSFSTSSNRSGSNSDSTSSQGSTTEATNNLPAPTIQNATDKGLVTSGFLIGSSVSGITSVEISIDNGTYSQATGTTTWRYQLPTGNSTWRDNSEHSVSIRGKDANNLNTVVTTIRVKKGRNRDINGDGYGDAVSSAQAFSSTQGKMYIFYSTGPNGITATQAISANRMITATGGNFGESMTLGDINGDGYADLVVGAGSLTTNTGASYIFYSSGTSGITQTTAASANRIINGEGTNNYFGSVMDTGDVNGDGFADLAVGAYGAQANRGRTYIFLSTGAGGITQTNASTANTIITGVNTTDYSGQSVVLADLQNDGFADLITSAPSFNTNNGAVYIFYSTSSAGISTAATSAANRTILGDSGGAPGGQFGYFMSSGDFNGDGYVDLAVPANIANTSRGRAYLFLSSASGIVATNATSANLTVTGENNSDRFGDTTCFADFNNDGYAEFIIGAGRNIGGASNGRVYMYSGSTTNPGGITVSASTLPKIITGNYAGRFGAAIGVSDINGDGYLDMLSSSNVAQPGGGSVNDGISTIFYNNRATSYFNQSTENTANTIITGELNATGRFGYNFPN
ncbi:MAG: FG-GAP repeat protein [Leptospiraceae bacterium]|nr:FG-GAP repeat protein [Leptospiraceae bacterium]